MSHIRHLTRFVAYSLILFVICAQAVPVVAEEAPTPVDPNQTTWSIGPADDSGPDDRVSIRHEVEPGEVIDEHIAVTNHSAATQEFIVYAGDGRLTGDGQFDIGPIDEANPGGGSWISIGDGHDDSVTVTIDPEQSAVIPIQITVPDSALPGDHPAGVVAAMSAGDSELAFEARTGVRLHLQVSGDIVPNLDVTVDSVSYQQSWNPFSPGNLVVRYSVANTGNVRLGFDPQVRTSGPFSWFSRRDSPGEVRELLPGGQLATEVVVDGVWPMIRVSGSVTANPLVVGDDSVGGDLVGEVDQFGGWAIGWIYLVLLVLVAALLWWVIWSRRRRAAQVQRAIDVALAEQARTGAKPTSAATDPAAAATRSDPELSDIKPN